jgi:hypothetical protein
MEAAIVSLSVACAVLAFTTAVLASSVPFLWHRAFLLERKLNTLDEALSGLLEAAGLGEKPAPRPQQPEPSRAGYNGLG